MMELLSLIASTILAKTLYLLKPARKVEGPCLVTCNGLCSSNDQSAFLSHYTVEDDVEKHWPAQLWTKLFSPASVLAAYPQLFRASALQSSSIKGEAGRILQAMLLINWSTIKEIVIAPYSMGNLVALELLNQLVDYIHANPLNSNAVALCKAIKGIMMIAPPLAGSTLASVVETLHLANWAVSSLALDSKTSQEVVEKAESLLNSPIKDASGVIINGGIKTMTFAETCKSYVMGLPMMVVPIESAARLKPTHSFISVPGADHYNINSFDENSMQWQLIKSFVASTLSTVPRPPEDFFSVFGNPGLAAPLGPTANIVARHYDISVEDFEAMLKTHIPDDGLPTAVQGNSYLVLYDKDDSKFEKLLATLMDKSPQEQVSHINAQYSADCWIVAGQSKTSILVDRKIKVYAFHFEGSPDMTEVDLEACGSLWKGSIETLDLNNTYLAIGEEASCLQIYPCNQSINAKDVQTTSIPTVVKAALAEYQSSTSEASIGFDNTALDRARTVIRETGLTAEEKFDTLEHLLDTIIKEPPPSNQQSIGTQTDKQTTQPMAARGRGSPASDISNKEIEGMHLKIIMDPEDCTLQGIRKWLAKHEPGVLSDLKSAKAQKAEYVRVVRKILESLDHRKAAKDEAQTSTVEHAQD